MENKFSLKIYPIAKSDLEGIFEYISNVLLNPIATINLINEFEKAFDKVCLFPNSCPFINNEYVKDKTLRKLMVKNYIAFYRVKENEVQIVRVLYGMSNYESLL